MCGVSSAIARCDPARASDGPGAGHEAVALVAQELDALDVAEVALHDVVLLVGDHKWRVVLQQPVCTQHGGRPRARVQRQWILRAVLPCSYVVILGVLRGR